MLVDSLITKVIRTMNRPTMALLAAPRLRWLTGTALTTITYVGRRSGRTVTLPVVYRQHDERVTVVVLWADAKTWWRNFLGAGAPLTLRLDGADRSGHAIAHRRGRRGVWVSVQLDPPGDDGAGGVSGR